MTNEEIRAHTDELVAALTAEHARIKRKRDAAEQMLQALRQFVAAFDTAKPNYLIRELSMACDAAKAAIRAAEGGD